MLTATIAGPSSPYCTTPKQRILSTVACLPPAASGPAPTKTSRRGNQNEGIRKPFPTKESPMHRYQHCHVARLLESSSLLAKQ